MEQIGRYLLRGEIGKGGFGAVYRAWDPGMRREVAIKVLTSINDPGMLSRFRSEPATTGILKHKNIVTVHDFGEHNSAPYLVMELIEGRSLREVIETGARASLPEKVAILGEIARGLLHAHQNGVIHRDVKPANIMLLTDGAVKILDFGIARLANPDLTRQTSTGIMIGTPQYMAPEQFAGEDASALSDIFAYGVVCYELLSGEHPFRGPHLAAVAHLVTTKVPAPLRTLAPDCPEGLESILQTAMAKRRSERYQSLQDLLFDLAPIEAGFRRDRLDGIASEAQRALESGDLDSAQKLVWRALELEPNHPASQELRRHIQRQRERPALEERWKGVVAAAESLCRRNSFDEAIQALEAARSWLLSDSVADLRADLEVRLTAATEAREKAQRIAALLAEANEAAGRHDLAAASRGAAEVLSLDSGNTVALALDRWVVGESEKERQRQEEVTAVRRGVREQIAALRFENASRSIENALQKYPGDRDLLALQALVEATGLAMRQQAAEALRGEEQRQAQMDNASKLVPGADGAIVQGQTAQFEMPIENSAADGLILPPDPAAVTQTRPVWGRLESRLTLIALGLLALAYGIGIWMQPHSPSAQEAPAPTANAPVREAPTVAPTLSAGSTKVNARDGLTYVWIPPGTFQMGCSPGDEECRDNEKPAHPVTISKGFWIGRTEVTQEAYEKARTTNPSEFKGAKLPVENISWDDAAEYCEFAGGMRLPTEAEWEYAARAGSTASRNGELDGIAWNAHNSGGRSHEVGGKEPNAWGLQDMLGNVWEWVADLPAKYPADSMADKVGPASGTFRAQRGGGWASEPRNVRVSIRSQDTPTVHRLNIGFRCAGS